MSDFESLKRRIEAVAAKSTPLFNGSKPFNEESLRAFCEGIKELIVGVKAFLRRPFKPYYTIVGCAIGRDGFTPVLIDDDEVWPDIYPDLADITPPSTITLTFFLRGSQIQE